MQVTGKFSAVVDKVKAGGPLTLYNGSLAAASATFVGHYPYVCRLSFSFAIVVTDMAIFLTLCILLLDHNKRQYAKTSHTHTHTHTHKQLVFYVQLLV